MDGFPSGLKLDCLTILYPCPQTVSALCISCFQVTPKSVVVSCPCTDFPLQNASLYFPSHQLLFQRPCAFFFPFHFGLYFPILWQCREEVKVIHLELGGKKKTKNKKPPPNSKLTIPNSKWLGETKCLWNLKT